MNNEGSHLTMPTMSITMDAFRPSGAFLYLMTGYKIFLTQKELQIKMSSLLNVPNASNKSEEFSLKDIEVFVDSEEQNCFKQAHLGKYLGIENIRTSLNDLEKCEMLTRQELVPTRHSTFGWSGPKYQQNKMDKFLSVFGVMYVIVNSQKDKGKALKEHILKDIVPRGFDARVKEIQEKHRQAIEEKDAAIALLNDDLKNREYDNVALQAQKGVYKDQLQKRQDIITHLRTRYLDHAKDPGKDNIVMIIDKNTAPEEDEFYEYPYYIARIQRRFINTKKQWLKAQYSHHRFITEELDNANSVHVFNKFEEEEFVERFQCHFRLVDIPRDALYALATPSIQE